MHQQFKSMAEMQRLQPPSSRRSTRSTRTTPTSGAEATMKLYQEHKVNPAAGACPFSSRCPSSSSSGRLIANYEFGQGLLWIPDLAPAPTPTTSSRSSTWPPPSSPPGSPPHGNKDVIRQGLFMNLIFVFLVLQFPAGVTLYWVPLSNLIGLFQQWLINKSLKPLTGVNWGHGREEEEH
jgi:YidC/Oxa1 family membrane protein insertase